MTDFINEMRDHVKATEDEHLEILANADGFSTNWTFSRTKTNPGFFTPFNRKAMVEDQYGDEWQRLMGIKQAATSMALLPALQLQTALYSAFMAPANLLACIGASIKGEWSDAADFGNTMFILAGGAVYFSGAFVLNLLKEVTALITRSIATLVDMCFGGSSNDVNPPLPDHGINLDDDNLDNDTDEQESNDGDNVFSV